MIDWFESTIIASFETICVHELDTPCAFNISQCLRNFYHPCACHTLTHISFLPLPILHGVLALHFDVLEYCLFIQSFFLILSVCALFFGMHKNFTAYNFLSSNSFFIRFIFKLKILHYLRNNSILEPFIYFKSQWIWLTN